MVEEQTESLANKEQQRRGRWILLLMFLFFAVPLLTVLLMHKLDWHPKGDSRGDLLVPPRKIELEGAVQWNERWSLVYLAAQCEQPCEKRLHDMRQLQVSMAKDIDRVQRILITTTVDVNGLKQQYPDMQLVQEPSDKLATWAAQFNIENEDSMTSGRLYLVDPLGNLMMSYPADVPAADVRKDLTRLLRYSWAG